VGDAGRHGWGSVLSRAEFTTVGDKFANMNGSRGNHYAHQTLMNAWKARAIVAIRQARCGPVAEPVVITATVHRTTRASSDAHNVSPTIKACVDAAVQCGLISDDNDSVVHAVTIRRGPTVRTTNPSTGKDIARPAITLAISTAPEGEAR